jgi:hypothetical protein
LRLLGLDRRCKSRRVGVGGLRKFIFRLKGGSINILLHFILSMTQFKVYNEFVYVKIKGYIVCDVEFPEIPKPNCCA